VYAERRYSMKSLGALKDDFWKFDTVIYTLNWYQCHNHGLHIITCRRLIIIAAQISHSLNARNFLLAKRLSIHLAFH
jgi:hypothetical protein